MLRFLRLPIAISAAIISSLSFFPPGGIAQEYPACFMVTLSRQVIDLNKLCQSQAPQKPEACQGPFDGDGFPIAYASELERLKAVVAGTRKRNDYASDFLNFQSAMTALLEQMPFSKRTQKLLQEQMLLLKQLQLQVTVNPEEAQNLQEKLIKNNDELSEVLERNSCFNQIMQSLDKKLEEP